MFLLMYIVSDTEMECSRPRTPQGPPLLSERWGPPRVPTWEPVTHAVPQGLRSSAPREGGGWGLFVAFPTQITKV